MSVEELIAPIRQSPHIHEAVETLLRELEEERDRRAAFYRDMTPEQKTEFIGGEVIMHSPVKRSHLIASGHIYTLLSLYVSTRQLGEVHSEKCLCVFPRNDYEPDIVFFGPDKVAGLESDTMKFPVPDLAVEILSPSTEDNDRGVKFEDFAANGVREYWIVDAVARSLEQYVLRDESYDLKMKSASGKLVCEAIEGFAVPVAAFFDREENVRVLTTFLL